MNKKITCSLFLDLTKAFDWNNHTILSNQFEKYSICGLPLTLSQNYLTNQRQFTLINDKAFDMKKITCGALQDPH